MPQPKSAAGSKPRQPSRLPSASRLLVSFVEDSKHWREKLDGKLDAIITEQHMHRENDRIDHAALGSRIERLEGMFGEGEGMPKRLVNLETAAAVRDGQETIKRRHLAVWSAVFGMVGGGAFGLGVEFLKKKLGW